MKNAILFMFFSMSTLCSFAQTQVVEAKTSAGSCMRMTITYQEGKAFVTREVVPCNGNLSTGITDVANVGVTEGRFIIPFFPTPGNMPYWFLPFDPAPAMSAPGGEYCTQCNCSGGGTCIQSSGGKCQAISCSSCSASVSSCGGAVIYNGSVAIVQASQVIFN